jgi:hypothetical protein
MSRRLGRLLSSKFLAQTHYQYSQGLVSITIFRSRFKRRASRPLTHSLDFDGGHQFSGICNSPDRLTAGK